MTISKDHVAAFEHLFQSSDRGFGVAFRPERNTKGKVVPKYETKREAYSSADIEAHLLGNMSIGLIPIRADNTCNWGAIDIDDYGIDPLDVVQRVEDTNIPLVACRTKSGGLHLYCFFDRPYEAETVQRGLRAIAEELGYPKAEIFPKQTNVSEGETGNFINMPYFGKERPALDNFGQPLSLDAFLKKAEISRISVDDLPEPKPSQKRTNATTTIAASGRNDWLFKKGLALHRSGINGDQLNAVLQQLNTDATPDDHPNFTDDALTTGEVDKIAESINTGRYSAGSPGASGKPFVLSDAKQTSELAAEAWPILEGLNQEQPQLFLFGGAQSRLTLEEGGARLEPINKDTLKYLLGEHADWFGSSSRNGNPQPIAVPAHVVTHMIETPSDRTPFLPLDRVVQSPVFAADGSLIQTNGYHANQRLYLDMPPDLAVPTVSTTPSDADILAAKTWILQNLLVDFPFEDDASLANSVAVLLLPFVRNIIAGDTPLHLIEKPSIGTGATLLAKVLALPAIGPNLEVSTEKHSEEEWRKYIFASLLEGRPFIAIDNLSRLLQGSALASALTSSTYRDRRLGYSETVSVPVRNVWLATGNNPELSDELIRRTVSIRLDAKMADPTSRTEFKHDDLVGWAAEHRGDLIWAALTLVQAWVADGMRHGEAKKASYEKWAGVVSGILDRVGIKGFLANTTKFRDRSSPEREAWHTLLAAWMQRAQMAKERKLGSAENKEWENGEVISSILLQLVEMYAIELPLGAGNEHQRVTRLGNMLRRQNSNIFEVEAPDGQMLDIIIKSRSGHGKRNYYYLHVPGKGDWRPGVQYEIL